MHGATVQEFYVIRCLKGTASVWFLIFLKRQGLEEY